MKVGFESTLGRITLRMASALDLDQVLAEITRGLVSDLEAAMARIWLVSAEDPGFLRLAASAGLSERLDGSRSRVPMGALKIGEIAKTRRPVWQSDLLADARFPDKAWIRDEGLAAFAGYPLVYGEELLGVLGMFAGRALSELEFEHLGMFAAQASVAIKNAELFSKVAELSRRLEAENSYLKEELQSRAPDAIVGRSVALTTVLAELERVAKTTSTVLLCGETGTGKELFARAIHEKSGRRGPLVRVNCAALAPTLVESELFGHEKGAFTGASSRRIGRFELARGGTLLLDEIGELPLEAQAKLLRVLQEHEFERVGGTQSIRADARIVAATNRDLASEAKASRFRSDLFFRLNVFPIVVPPLRERREDIPALVDAFLRELAPRAGLPPKTMDADAAAYLQAYDWPGNVRELHNVVERAAILARGVRIEASDLPELASTLDRSPVSTAPDEAAPLKDRVSAYERAVLLEALGRADGNQSEAARLLKTSRATLQYRMKVLKI